QLKNVLLFINLLNLFLRRFMFSHLAQMQKLTLPDLETPPKFKGDEDTHNSRLLPLPLPPLFQHTHISQFNSNHSTGKSQNFSRPLPPTPDFSNVSLIADQIIQQQYISSLGQHRNLYTPEAQNRSNNKNHPTAFSQPQSQSQPEPKQSEKHTALPPLKSYFYNPDVNLPSQNSSIHSIDKLQIFARLKCHDYQKDSSKNIHTHNNSISFPLKHTNNNTFEFSNIFPSSSDNKYVSNTILQPYIDKVIKGQNALVIAYGHSDSGKTFSIIGNENVNNSQCYAILPTAFKMLIESQMKLTTILFSAIEVYGINAENTKHFDLLIDNHQGMKDLKPQKATQLAITNITAFQPIIERIRKNTHSTAIRHNYKSSRGHVVYTIKLYQKFSSVVTTPLVSTLTIIDCAWAGNIHFKIANVISPLPRNEVQQLREKEDEVIQQGNDQLRKLFQDIAVNRSPYATEIGRLKALLLPLSSQLTWVAVLTTIAEDINDVNTIDKMLQFISNVNLNYSNLNSKQNSTTTNVPQKVTSTTLSQEFANTCPHQSNVLPQLFNTREPLRPAVDKIQPHNTQNLSVDNNDITYIQKEKIKKALIEHIYEQPNTSNAKNTIPSNQNAVRQIVSATVNDVTIETRDNKQVNNSTTNHVHTSNHHLLHPVINTEIAKSQRNTESPTTDENIAKSSNKEDEEKYPTASDSEIVSEQESEIDPKNYTDLDDEYMQFKDHLNINQVCPISDCGYTTNSEKLRVLIAHINKHTTGRLAGNIPESFLEKHNRIVCSHCKKTLAKGRAINNMHTRCSVSKSQSHPNGQVEIVPVQIQHHFLWSDITPVFVAKKPAKLIARVPKEARLLFAAGVSSCLQNIIENNNIQAWTAWMVYIRSMLWQPEREGKQHIRTLTNTIVNRIQRWRAGEKQQLWFEFLAHSQKIKEKPRRDNPPKRSEDSIRSSCMKYAALGEYSKAFQSMKPTQATLYNDNTIAALQAKHPYEDSPQIPIQNRRASNSRSKVQSITVDELREYIQKLHRSSSGGIDLFAAQFLHDIEPFDLETYAITNWARVAHMIASGNVCEEARAITYGARLIAVSKPDGSPRPIAIGSLFRRSASAILVKRHAEDLKNLVGHKQFGINTIKGIELFSHRVHQGDQLGSALFAIVLADALELALKEIRNIYHAAYHDDLVIAANDSATAVQAIENLIHLRQSHGIEININKCEWLAEETNTPPTQLAGIKHVTDFNTTLVSKQWKNTWTVGMEILTISKM
ncbi:kinesin family member 4, partial [Reticulomyxa filosa]